MNVNERYYRDSGAIPFFGSLLTTVLGLVAGVGLGAVYGYLSTWNPYLLLQLLGVMIVGGGIGFAVNMCVIVGKVRNPWFPRMVGFVSGCAAVYAEWVAYFMVDGKHVSSPDRLFNEILNEGDVMLYILWGIEALAIIGIAVMLASARDIPFCEECGEWAEELEDCAMFENTDLDKLRMDLENERYEVLDELRIGGAPSDCLRATVYQCPCDGEENYLTIKHVFVTIDSDGDESRNETEIVKRLWIPDDVVERLLEPAPVDDTPDELDDEPIPNSARVDDSTDDEEDDVDELFERD